MTNKNQLIEKLLNNWYLKLLCLIAAILIYVFYKSSLVETKSFVVPLNVIENGTVICVEEPRETIKVVVKADADHISLIRNTDISASINLNNITKSGYVTVPVKVSVPADYYAYNPFQINAEPESIKLKVEKKTVGNIPLKPSVTGIPAHGFEVSSVTIEPEYIEVAGAESVLNFTDCINTTAVNVSELKASTTVEVNPIALNKQLEILNKGPYKVTVTFESQMMEKSLEKLKIYTTGLWPDLQIETELPSVDVVLEGAVNILENYNPGKNTVIIDLSSITEPGTYELPLKCYFPQAFSVKSMSLENISVNVVQMKDKEQVTPVVTPQNTETSEVNVPEVETVPQSEEQSGETE